MARQVPADLEDALAASPAARERFWALPPEQLDQWVRWVERSRFPRTRRRRIAETVLRLAGRRPVAPARAVETNGVGPVPAPPSDVWLVWLIGIALLAGIVALVLWFTVFHHHSAKPAAVVVSAKATVPHVVGIRRQAAEFQLKQAKLAVTVVKHAGTKPRGIVIAQKPKAGAAVPQGSPVTIVVSNGPAGVKVPSVVGLAAADAVKRLQALKLATTLKQTPSKQSPGTVLAQHPPAGTLAKPGTQVVLDVAGSKTSVAVPDLSGQTQQAAVAALKQAGLTATVVQVASSQPAGTVTAQNPAAGTNVAQGSAVRLNVAKGQGQTQTSTQQQTTTSSAPAPPPQQGSGNDYRGMQLSRAVDKILQGRQQVIVVWIASSKPKGVVVANSTVGSREQLQVSAGPKPAAATDVPDVSGETQSQAAGDLQSAGFVVIAVPWPVSDKTVDGTVVNETPAGGSKAPRGATIVIYIGSFSGG